MAEKKQKFTTPPAKCNWPKLNKPDYEFKKDTGEFSVKLVFSKEEVDALPFKATLDEMAEKAYQEAINNPKNAAVKDDIRKYNWLRREVDASGEPTGNYEVSFSTLAMFADDKDGKRNIKHVPMFDAHEPPQLIPDGARPQIGRGSVLRVSFTPSPYYIPGTRTAGIKLYLNAVQIISLITYNADASAYGFGGEEGGYTTGPQEESPAEDRTITPEEEDHIRELAKERGMKSLELLSIMEDAGAVNSKGDILFNLLHISKYKDVISKIENSCPF